MRRKKKGDGYIGTGTWGGKQVRVYSVRQVKRGQNGWFLESTDPRKVGVQAFLNTLPSFGRFTPSPGWCDKDEDLDNTPRSGYYGIAQPPVLFRLDVL